MDYGRDYDRSSYATLAPTVLEEEKVEAVRVEEIIAVKGVEVAAAAAKTVSQEGETPVSVPSSNPAASIFDSLIGNTRRPNLGNAISSSTLLACLLCSRAHVDIAATQQSLRQ